jgi:hypothetical protein
MVNPCEGICDKSTLKLDNLDKLILYQDTEQLSCDLFEKIVEALIFPGDNSHKTQTHKKVSITVLVALGIEKEVEWRQSRLLSTATEESTVITRWDYDYNSYCFTWNKCRCVLLVF